LIFFFISAPIVLFCVPSDQLTAVDTENLIEAIDQELVQEKLKLAAIAAEEESSTDPQLEQEEKKNKVGCPYIFGANFYHCLHKNNGSKMNNEKTCKMMFVGFEKQCKEKSSPFTRIKFRECALFLRFLLK
jgi:hypothetical protein